MQEGISSEASSLAGHLALGRLIVLYDDNQITIDGETDLSFTEDVVKRYDAYGWHTQTVGDVADNVEELRAAIAAAKAVTDKPSLIKVKTSIGQGSPSKQGKESAHGAPLGKDDLAGMKQAYGFPVDEMFHVPPEVQEFYTQAAVRADSRRVAWEGLFQEYTKAYPAKAAEISRTFANKLPEGILDKLPTYVAGKDKDLATRKHSHLCLEAIGPNMSELIGGSADLTPSNLTDYTGVVDFQKDSYIGRYLRFGVREHGMVAICNGIFAHGGLRPYCATFLNFVGYCIGAIRLSALSKFGIIYVMTHDSIGLGEDGPTHQPVETLETLRCMPNINVFRPADGNEMNAAYAAALSTYERPSVICCSRSTVKSLQQSSVEKASKGAYAVVEEASPDLVIVSTGSEVTFSVAAAERLISSGIKTRVVSMPCQEVFLEQSDDYQRSILPGNVPTLSVEASVVNGRHRFSHSQIGMGRFGISGPGEKVFDHFGFSPENIESQGKKLVEFYKTHGNVPDLNNRPPAFTVMHDEGIP